MDSDADTSFHDWRSGQLDPIQHRHPLEGDFSKWLTNRLNAEQETIFEEFQTRLQLRQQHLQADIIEEFRRCALIATDRCKASEAPARPSPAVAVRQGTCDTAPDRNEVSVATYSARSPKVPDKVLVEDPVHTKPCEPEEQPVKFTVNSDVSLKEGSGKTSTHCQIASWERCEIFFGIVIVLQAIVVMLEAQVKGIDQGHALRMKGYSRSGHDMFPFASGMLDMLRIFFNIFFALELAVRLYRAKLRFYRCPWIWLDLVIVPLAWLHMLNVFQFTVVDPISMRMLRVMRLCMLATTMKCVKKLDLLIRAIRASMSALLWSFSVIFFVQVVAGMLLNQMLGDVYDDPSIELEARQDLFEFFGTTSRTLLTMFHILFANWAAPCWLLVQNVSEWYGLFFVVYRCILGWALLRVISSLFIAETHRISTRDKELETLEKMRNSEYHMKQLRDLFQVVDKSGDGKLTIEELRIALDDPNSLLIADSIGIDPLHLEELFWMMAGEHGHVSINEFIAGALKVDGLARSIDMLAILRTLEQLMAKLDRKSSDNKLVAALPDVALMKALCSTQKQLFQDVQLVLLILCYCLYRV